MEPAPHNNQSLFSEHFLNEVLPERPQWKLLEAEARSTMERVSELLGKFNRASNESQTERNLVIPVLELLGHTFEVQASLATPQGAMTPDYVLYRDAKACEDNKGKTLNDELPHQGGIAIGDAKRWGRSLDAAVKTQGRDAFSNKNPSYQISFYMLHSAVSWGILTNGRQWRIYHKDTARKLDHFYEVDLEALIESNDVRRFLYFYAFFRRAAFDDGPLSLAVILKESSDYAYSIGESLKEQVYVALRHIAQGFLDHEPNNLQPDNDTLKTIYDNSLILLYRLLFILYAEARELLPMGESDKYRQSYSLAAIKQSVARNIDSGKAVLHGSPLLYKQLDFLFHGIDTGEEELGIEPFNGGLFDPEEHPFLVKNAVGDYHLQVAIDKLARVNGGFVDYRDLSVRHLGTIYEGLLEHRLVLLPKPEDGWIVTLASDKGERKTTGSYFTPDQIVKHVVAGTLDPILERAAGSEDTDEGKLRAVLAVNVLDPAMGSGHFLVEATEHIARFLVDLGIVPRGKTKGEADLAFWKRRVAQSCIYGVDLNPLAVELAKLSLWLTTVAKGRPLSFLDHHLRPGNSLVGASLDHLKLKTVTTRKKKAKAPKVEPNGQIALLTDSDFAVKVSGAVDMMARIEESEAATYKQVKEQETLYEGLRRDLTNKYSRLLNLVTAAQFGLAVDRWVRDKLIDFVMKNGGASFPVYDRILNAAGEIAARQGFFHWEVEFPEIYFDQTGQPLGDRAGFDAVIGNPPWERIKLQENEFFAARDPEISRAPRAADRKMLIKALPKKKPALWKEYEAAREDAERFLAYVRDSGFYPLMGKGDTNLYAVFAEKALRLMNKSGRVGIVVPSGIATDATTKDYFQHIVNHRMLSELLDFENRQGLFPEVDSRFKFSTLLLTGESQPQDTIRCGFFLHNVAEADDPARICTLSPDDFRLFNPNTLTCPVFRRCRDAELTKKIYQHVPVLIRSDREDGNPWGVSFQRMFDMTNDSNLFRRGSELEKDGFWLGPGNVYTKGDIQFLPLYEGKMVQMYDHRAASVVVNPDNLFRPAQPEPVTLAQHADVAFTPTFQFWVAGSDVAARLGQHKAAWHIAFKDVTSPTNERTFIALAVPPVGFGNKLPLLRANAASCTPLLLANLNSLPLDYATRQKIGGQTLNFFIVEQLPVLPPSAYEADWHGVSLKDFIKERVLELTYTAHDIKGFAEDMGYDGQPFVWDEEGRLHLRCQLDAIYFHLYGLTRDEAGEILDTFPIVKRQDEARYGSFRTKDLILSYYNAYAAGNMDAWVKG